MVRCLLSPPPAEGSLPVFTRPWQDAVVPAGFTDPRVLRGVRISDLKLELTPLSKPSGMRLIPSGSHLPGNLVLPFGFLTSGKCQCVVSLRARVPASILTGALGLDSGTRYVLLCLCLPDIRSPILKAVLFYVPWILGGSDYPLSLIPYRAPSTVPAAPVCARRSSLCAHTVGVGQ